MPVVTRSKYNAVNNMAFLYNKKRIFVYTVKDYLKEQSEAVGMSDQMKAAFKLMKYINEELPPIIDLIGMKFVLCVYSKTVQFSDEFNRGKYEELDRVLVKQFMREIEKSEKMARKYILNHHMDYTPVSETDAQNLQIFKTALKDRKNRAKKIAKDTYKQNIVPTTNVRPRRNIPRVDYTGMDTIEPEDEYDGITDIWYDDSISYDPDYNPEEDKM